MQPIPHFLLAINGRTRYSMYLGPPALPRMGGRGWTLLNFDPSRVVPPLKRVEGMEEEVGEK